MNVLYKHKERRDLIESGYGFNLTEKQRQVFECEDRRASFTFSRQEGCTTAACLKAFDFAIKNPCSSVAVYVPTKASAKYTVEALRHIIDQCDRIINKFESRRFNMFFLKNGSTIIIDSVNQSSIRGRKHDLVIVDGTRMFNGYDLDCIECTTLSSSIGQAIMLNQNDSFMTNLQ